MPVLPADPGKGAALELRAVGKAFGATRSVVDLSLRVERGTFVTLLGPSGSGKTTTLRMIAGFEEPTEGEILLDGADITDRPAHRRNIGIVFQHYALFPHMTVFRNVAYPLEMRRVARAETRRRVEQALELVQLAGYEDRYPRQLSGGQQQRVALARAIVFEPPVLLLDEPLAALDKRLRELMQVEVRALQKKLGITTISVTHDQTEALVMSDQVAVLRDGRLQQMAPPLEVYRRPANEFVADFLGEANLLRGAASGGRFRTAAGLDVATGPDGAAGGSCLVVRPEYVRIGTAAAGLANRFEAEIREVFYAGDLVRYRVRLAGGEELSVKALASDRQPGLEIGKPASVGWEAADCRVVGQ